MYAKNEDYINLNYDPYLWSHEKAKSKLNF